MPNHTRTVATIVALSVAADGGAPPVLADPLPSYCVPAAADGTCSVRLESVTSDVINGTITGAPMAGGSAIVLAGQGDAYLPSSGFGDAAPESIRRWDETVAAVNTLSVDPSDPNWYGNAKAKVFLPRTLNDLAATFPPGSLVVRFAPDESQPGVYRLTSIQPTAQ